MNPLSLMSNPAGSNSHSPVEGVSKPPDEGKNIFMLFPLLPLEIRLLIWNFVCFQPRLVDLWATMNGIEVLARMFLDEGLEELYYYYTHCGTVPSILHTSREARTVGLQYYQLEFGTETKEMFSRPSRGSLSFSTPPRIFVNWECDIICPMTDSQSDLEDPEISLALASMYPQIRRFAIPAGDIRGKPQFGASLHQDLRPLIALLSKPEGSPSMPLHEVILYCYRSSDTPEICEFDHVSLQFASICGIDDQNTVPIPLWGTVQLQHMREARDNVMRVIEVVSGRSKQKNKKFVPPVISFAFLDVSWRSRSNARKRSILGIGNC